MQLTIDRDEIIASIKNHDCFDVVVIGGGIHGASFARAAAYNGLSVLLTEKRDYASATSSRSSKLAHGGIRYLELFDLKQVFEGIKARGHLFKTAPHLVRPFKMLFPLKEKIGFERLKISIGLWLYHLFADSEHKKYEWISAPNMAHKSVHVLGDLAAGGYQFIDGQMDDTRLVIENILSARGRGAVCLNYLEVESIVKEEEAHLIKLTDNISSERLEVKSKVVVNCAGPWVQDIVNKAGTNLSTNLRYSQGTHLIFSKDWPEPGLILPLKLPSRYYFILPHPAGALVGTTERDVDKLADDPLPSEEKINEILARIKRDLPDSGLTKENLHYCYAGIRTLAVTNKNDSTVNTSELSRSPRWEKNGNILTLIGGKYTTAGLTSEKGLKLLFRLLDKKSNPVSVVNKPFSKAATPLISKKDLNDKPKILKMVENTLDHEQAETLEDIMRRRLVLEHFPGAGINLLEDIISILKSRRSKLDVQQQVDAYLQRHSKIEETLKKCHF